MGGARAALGVVGVSGEIWQQAPAALRLAGGAHRGQKLGHRVDTAASEGLGGAGAPGREEHSQGRKGSLVAAAIVSGARVYPFGRAMASGVSRRGGPVQQKRYSFSR